MTIKEDINCQLYNMDSILNPENKPVEELKIKYKSKDSIYEELIPALDERWCNKDYIYTVFNLPPKQQNDGVLPMGSKEDWIERMLMFIDDMNLLLDAKHHKFWSEVVNRVQCLAGLSSFLQCMFPFYMENNISKDNDILQGLRRAREKVFLLLTRLTTTKESEKAWMKSSTLGNILYNNFVLSLPQLMEICVVFGGENCNDVSKLINRVIDVQPKYITNDLEKAIPFIKQVLIEFELQLSPGKEVNGEPCQVSSQKRPLGKGELGRMILLIMDISYSLASFLQACPRAAELGHSFQLESRIAKFYDSAIPEICKQVNSLFKKENNNDLNRKYHMKVAETRHQLLLVVHSCLRIYLGSIIEYSSKDQPTSEEVRHMVDGYLDTVSECLSAHSFIRDFDKAFPIQKELSMLTDIAPEIDSKKYAFILESVASSYELPKLGRVNTNFENTTDTLESQGLSSEQIESSLTKKVTGVELESLIAEVKDILPHLGDGYITKCLEHFKYVGSDVVNAILENSLPESLLSLDPEMPLLPPECVQTSNGHPERINVFDNDDFDILNRDDVDLSKVHKGKRQDKHKNLSELLDDKTHVRELKEVYTQLSLVETLEDVSLYDDEYDDTYDDVDASVGNDGSTEAEERRAFVTPRVLQQHRRQEEPEENAWEEGEEEEGGRAKKPDWFVENPADLRARAEQRRLETRGRGHPTRHRDVVGKPKGQGQEKEVVASREFKNTNKASRGNHNRRAMADKKRRQGMFPS